VYVLYKQRIKKKEDEEKKERERKVYAYHFSNTYNDHA
jgi:hypothetical protein